MKIVTYKPEYAQAFRDLNLAWLEKYFTVEPVHLKVLDNPEGTIIAPGGEVFFALEGDTVVGTVAVRALGEGRFELTKLGVDPSAQGGGIGRTLCVAVLDWFLERGGKTLFLETHTKLKPAMRLYKKLGFELTTNPDAGGYAGTDCYMEWRAPAVVIHKAQTSGDIAACKEVFRAFSEWLPIDLGFQNFEEEMARFPVGYVHLLIAKKDGKPVGAVALKEHDKDTCEMKRLYMLPEAQGTGAGRAICERLMADAKALGYKVMLLDSLRRLDAAVALYVKLGFEEIEPYNFNPEDDVVYMRKAL
ncbi:GNAT family N-acetyltransferase [Kordiimonas gwangyangensis]|uniref:GNAT family N-acetyltransferase n=1 Tax=Kordiimonas gwangyangensis TaxID=288022 RepID=UPI00036C7F03|nr:GNAT family N-acetyltransferase [Kordiimonas gwangyangensis]